MGLVTLKGYATLFLFAHFLIVTLLTIETANMVLLKGEPPRLFKIQRTINDVTFDDVYNLIENPLPCC